MKMWWKILFFYSHKITDNPDNVLTFRPHDLAEYSAEWVMTYIFVLYLAFRKCLIVLQGVKLIFFSDSHLAPKFFKVVANSKKVGRHFQRQTKPFFYAVIVLEIKLGKRSLTCYKVDNRMDDMQRSSSPKSILNLVIDREACAAFWKQT